MSEGADRGTLGGHPRRRVGHAAVAALARALPEVPPRPDGVGALAAAGDLGPARAARRATASSSSPAPPTWRPCAASCRCSPATTSWRSPPPATRCRPSGWPPRSSSGATPRRCSARSPPTTSSPTSRPSALRSRRPSSLARRGELVTIGIEPTRPATGFGYIRLGCRSPSRARRSAQRVADFVEKPDAETARRYVDSGEYRWNAGMFVVGATTLLEMLAEEHPEMSTTCAPSPATRAHAGPVAEPAQDRHRPRRRRARRRRGTGRRRARGHGLGRHR